MAEITANCRDCGAPFVASRTGRTVRCPKCRAARADRISARAASEARMVAETESLAFRNKARAVRQIGNALASVVRQAPGPESWLVVETRSEEPVRKGRPLYRTRGAALAAATRFRRDSVADWGEEMADRFEVIRRADLDQWQAAVNLGRTLSGLQWETMERIAAVAIGSALRWLVLTAPTRCEVCRAETFGQGCLACEMAEERAARAIGEALWRIKLSADHRAALADLDRAREIEWDAAIAIGRALRYIGGIMAARAIGDTLWHVRALSGLWRETMERAAAEAIGSALFDLYVVAPNRCARCRTIIPADCFNCLDCEMVEEDAAVAIGTALRAAMGMRWAPCDCCGSTGACSCPNMGSEPGRIRRAGERGAGIVAAVIGAPVVAVGILVARDALTVVSRALGGH